MSTWGVHEFAQSDPAVCCHEVDDVVEIPLLLSSWQVEALESVAHQQGQTAGEMIRQLLLEHLTRQADR